MLSNLFTVQKNTKAAMHQTTYLNNFRYHLVKKMTTLFLIILWQCCHFEGVSDTYFHVQIQCLITQCIPISRIILHGNICPRPRE